MRQDSIAALESLLARERSVLLAGDLAGIAELTRQKERLVDALTHSIVADPLRWQALDRMAHRNQRLLASALAGVRAATERLAAMRHNLNQLDTYSHDGQRQALGEQRRQLERKA